MYIALIIAAFVVFLVLAVLARTAKLSDHEGAANTVSFVKLVSTLLATAVGAGLIFGLVQFGRQYGTIGILLAVVYCLSFVGLGVLAPQIRLFCRAMKERGIIREGENLSLTLILARKYDLVTWGLILLAYGVIYSAFLAAQYVAISTIIQSMGVDLAGPLLIAASAFVVFLYISIGGYRAVLHSDIVQFAAIVIILAIGIWLVFSTGKADFTKLPDSYWNPFSSPTVTSHFVWLAVFIFPSLLLRVDHWQRIVTAANDGVARWAYIASGFLLVLVFLVLLAIGAAAQMAGSDAPLWIYQEGLRDSASSVGVFFYGVALTAFLCAVLSSADTILNSMSAFTTQSLHAWGVLKNERSVSAVVVNFVLSGLALLFALWVPKIIPLITEGFKVLTILLPSVVAAILLKEPSNNAARGSIIAGFVAYILTKLVWQAASEWAYVVGFLVSLFSLLVIYGLEARRKAHKVGQ